MSHIITRRTLLAGSAGAGLAGFAGRGVQAAAPPKKLKIALSNSYIGNKWRIEMENVFKAALLMEPYKTEVEGSWFNSGNDVSKQTQQISNLIAERVDAIVIDAASPTGLNGILQPGDRRAASWCISFDNIVTEPGALEGQHRPVRIRPQVARNGSRRRWAARATSSW